MPDDFDLDIRLDTGTAALPLEPPTRGVIDPQGRDEGDPPSSLEPPTRG